MLNEEREQERREREREKLVKSKKTNSCMCFSGQTEAHEVCNYHLII